MDRLLPRAAAAAFLLPPPPPPPPAPPVATPPPPWGRGGAGAAGRWRLRVPARPRLLRPQARSLGSSVLPSLPPHSGAGFAPEQPSRQLPGCQLTASPTTARAAYTASSAASLTPSHGSSWQPYKGSAITLQAAGDIPPGQPHHHPTAAWPSAPQPPGHGTGILLSPIPFWENRESSGTDERDQAFMGK